MRDILIWITWTIWTSRNQQIFESQSSSLMEVISRALSNAQEWTRIQWDLHTLQVIPTSTLQPPMTSIPPDVILCNSDAAWNPITKAAGLGWIFITWDSQAKHMHPVGSPSRSSCGRCCSLTRHSLWLQQNLASFRLPWANQSHRFDIKAEGSLWNSLGRENPIILFQFRLFFVCSKNP